MTGKHKRRRPNLTEQVAILARQARCAKTGEILGTPANIEWHHLHEVELDGPSTIDNLVAVSKAGHDILTNGPGGEKRITSAGSSKHRIAKARRLEKERLGTAKKKLKKAWPARPFPKRPKPMKG